MHFNNYFVEHLREDLRWGGGGGGGGGTQKKIKKKEAGSLAIYMVLRGALTEIFPTYFPPPPLNNRKE